MKKILLIDDSDTYTWCLQKYLQHRGYPVKTACTLKEARTAIQEEMPLVVCCDLDLPDGSGVDFLDEVRTADKELPFILASCHDKDDYEQEAMRRGATLCMDKMKGLLRVMCAGLLLVFIQVAPQFTLLYTLKLVTLINLGIQTMKLNGVYKYKRTGILPPGGALSNLTRLNPFKKK